MAEANQVPLPIPPGIGRDIDAELTAPLELPAVPGKPLTTQGGSTLDDGSGIATLGPSSGWQLSGPIASSGMQVSFEGNVESSFGAGGAAPGVGGNGADVFVNSAGSGNLYLRPGANSAYATVISPPGDLSCAGHINPTPTTPALPANPPVSGTVYQNTTGGPIIITVPITATAVGGSGQWALGSTNTPGNWGGAEQIGVSGETHNMTLYVPNNWYWSLTVASATIGTASVLGL